MTSNSRSWRWRVTRTSRYTTQNKKMVRDFWPWLYCVPKSKILATGSCRKTPKICGTGSSIPAENCSDFFRSIPVNFLCVLTGTGRKSSKKVQKISGRNTASMFQRFPVFSGRNRPVLIDLGMKYKLSKSSNLIERKRLMVIEILCLWGTDWIEVW